MPNNRRAPIKPLLLTDKQTAQALGIGRSSVWTLAKRGQLRPVKLSTKITRFRRADVERLAESD
jgi:predicted DNA-binding transcriptional regulator AlpA